MKLWMMLSVVAVLLVGCGGTSNKRPVSMDRGPAGDGGIGQEEPETTSPDEPQQAMDDAAEETMRDDAAEQELMDVKQDLMEAEQALEEEREAAELARQKLNQAEARRALEGLKRTGSAGTVGSLIARYGDEATVTVTADPPDPPVTFRNGRGKSSGPWYVTTVSNAGATHDDELVVYTDVDRPESVPIRERHPDRFDPVVGSTSQIMTEIMTEKMTVGEEDDSSLIESSQFPSGGRMKEFDLTVDSSGGDTYYTTGRINGSFNGASGYFQCTSARATDNGCKVEHRGDRYKVSGPSGTTWTFTTSASSRVSVPDKSYMYFGWWIRQKLDDESFSFATFADVSDTEGHQVYNFNNLGGTAEYEGPAIGRYAIYQPLGAQSGHGEFTATARLEANFTTDMLSGSVTDFSNDPDWSLTLKATEVINGSTGTGARGGHVSWTIAGNTEDGGNWNGKFYSDGPYVGQIPDGVTGTFTAKFQ